MMKGRMKSGYSCSMVPPEDWLAAAADTLCCTARLHTHTHTHTSIIIIMLIIMTTMHCFLVGLLGLLFIGTCRRDHVPISTFVSHKPITPCVADACA